MARLQEAASKVSGDLTRTLGPAWSCSVADDYVLTVRGFPADVHVLVPGAVQDERWFVHPTFTTSALAASLSREAEETVGSHVTDALHQHGVLWPRCLIHGVPVDCSEGFWVCRDEPEHDIAAVGQLLAHRPQA